MGGKSTPQHFQFSFKNKKMEEGRNTQTTRHTEILILIDKDKLVEFLCSLGTFRVNNFISIALINKFCLLVVLVPGPEWLPRSIHNNNYWALSSFYISIRGAAFFVSRFPVISKRFESNFLASGSLPFSMLELSYWFYILHAWWFSKI